MSVLRKILENDLHRSKSTVSARPLILDIPCNESFIPSVISSSSHDKFLVSKKIAKNNGISYIRTGVFKHEFEKIDDVITNLFMKAYEVSVEYGYANVFTSVDKAKKRIKKCSCDDAQPHIALIPKNLTDARLKSLFRGVKVTDKAVLHGTCSLIKCHDMDKIMFLSKPEYVGMYTQFLGDFASIILHNIELGIAFVDL